MKLIIYTDKEMYRMHCVEYQIIWNFEGDKIQKSFEKILSLQFNENEIKLLINDGRNNSNFSGNTKNDPMNFRYNNRCKLGTFLHELSHRIVMEYSLLKIAEQKYNITDIHQLIDLFLYDIISDLYGISAANLRVDYESNFEGNIYSNSWNYALSFTFEQRQEMLKNIVGEVK